MTGSAPITEVHQNGLSQHPVADEPALPVYEPFAVIGTKGTSDGFYDLKSDRSICALIEAVVGKEGPVSLDLVARRVAEHWGVERITFRAVKRIEGLSGKANVKVVRETDGVFLWTPSQDPKTFSLFRTQEVANAALHVLEQHVSLPVADLVRETARLLGYQRTGPTVGKAMRGGIGLLVRKGGAKEENGVVVHLG